MVSSEGCRSRSFQKQLATLNMDVLGERPSSQSVLESTISGLEIWFCYF